MDKRVFLLDAMALIFRAYYALISSPRITSKGRNTNAQFGFTNALIELINNQKPSHMAVCFDTEAPTERHTDFAEYKANRQEAPEDLISALPDIKAIVKGFNIPCVELDGFEADDVIGTLSKQAEAAGYEVYMVTPDKDYGQLVTGKIHIYKPGYQGGVAEVLGPKEVCEKWNIKEVAQVIDILGLMGDAVDNIPGIRGVGEKPAARLLTEWPLRRRVLRARSVLTDDAGRPGSDIPSTAGSRSNGRPHEARGGERIPVWSCEGHREGVEETKRETPSLRGPVNAEAPGPAVWSS